MALNYTLDDLLRQMPEVQASDLHLRVGEPPIFRIHGELVRLKPHPRHLTSFYLTVSVGGALGGAV